MNDHPISTETSPAIRARNLSKTYWFTEKEAGLSGSLRALFKGRRVFVEAVKSVDLTLQVGEVVGFIGPNGAGKTTTLKMLSGILHPSSGEISILGFCPQLRQKAFLKSITLVTGQRNRLFWDLPAEEYFEFCRIIYEIPPAEYRKNLSRLVEMAEIGDILKTPQRKLSAGERKRCEIVAALLHDPQIIFLDEPTNALDLVNARKIRQFIREKGKDGRHTIILTSHNMADIEQVCEKIVIINQGRIVFEGLLPELYRLQGSTREIKMILREAKPLTLLKEMGKVTKANGLEVWLEVEAGRAAAIASRLFAAFPVQDISIMDPPLEKVIEAIYRQPLPCHPLTDPLPCRAGRIGGQRG